MTQPDAQVLNPKASPLSRGMGLFVAAHPFPAALNGLAGGAVEALAAEGVSVTTALVAVALALIHASIGAMNDWVGRDTDQMTNPDKPLVRGLVSPGAVLALSVVAAAAGLWGAWRTGALPVGAAILLAGAAYNLLLKGTLWSWTPYAVAIPSAAVWGFLAAGADSPWIHLTYLVGAVLAVGLNLANTIPDLEGDAALRMAGLAHQLGLRGAQAAALSAVALSGLAVAVLAAAAGLTEAATGSLGVAGAGVALMAAGYARGDRRSLRLAWFACALSAVGLAVCWTMVLKALTVVSM